MRPDEEGNPVPATLGEYLKLCEAIGGKKCMAAVLLRRKIEQSLLGENEEVLPPDSQMRALLMPLLLEQTE